MTICTICARGGSKGVPGKNVRMLAGKPLIAHSVQHAIESGLFDAIAVSSDSDDILDAAAKAGATVLVVRPHELATDQAAKIPAIRHCVLAAEAELKRQFNVVVDLDVTSPLRSAADVVDAYNLLINTDAQNVITAMPARRSPYFNMVEIDQAGYAHLSKPVAEAVVRRQESPPCFDMNASIYVWHRKTLLSHDRIFLPRTRLLVMPEERSIDIDTELDFQLVALILQNAQQGK